MPHQAMKFNDKVFSGQHFTCSARQLLNRAHKSFVPLEAISRTYTLTNISIQLVNVCLQAVLFVLCSLPLQAPYEGWLEHMEQEA